MADSESRTAAADRSPASPQAQRAGEIRTMFSRLVPHYDRMNRVMTAGLDGRWRRAAARAAAPAGGMVLDLGAGTGDLARTLHEAGARHVVGADFAGPMLRAARRKPGLARASFDWVQADALRLPFPDGTFDALASGFVLRNLVDLPAALAEMLRVLKPGGRLVALDITHPPDGPYGTLLRTGFRYLVTPIAGVLSGDRAAYRYLPSSLSGYPGAGRLAEMLAEAGATDVRYRRLGAGNVALHVAHKPPA